MKPFIVSIKIPGKSKAHVALLSVSFRLVAHSPANSDKVCVSFNDKSGTLIYITLYPETKDCKEYLKIMSDDQRKSVAQQFCDMIRDEIFVFFASDKDCNGEYKESTNLMLDDWRSYWEDSLDTIILDAMSD